jgi:hypothetical protein
MKLISDYIGKNFRIVQPSIFKRIFELNVDNELLLNMHYPKTFSSLAEVEGFDGKWKIKKAGFWKSTLQVFQKDNDLPFATYRGSFWGREGVIELPKGEKLNCKFNLWKSLFQIYTSSGILLLSIKTNISVKIRLLKGTKAEVTIEKKSDLLDKHPWIVMLVWYKILESTRNAAH